MWEHVIPGSMRFVYCDTDSIAVATTRTKEPEDDTPRARLASVWFPIIRPEMMASFLAQWEHWFVLTNTTADKRFPGKLKCE